MDFEDIKELIKIFDASSLNRLSITQEITTVKLEKGIQNATRQVPVAVPQSTSTPQQNSPQTATIVSASPQVTSSGDTINSPMVGTFYRCPSPNAPAYVNVGDRVKKGQTLAIIEAMKIMNEIEAEFDCKIIEIIPNDAQPIEYNSPLFIVERL